MDDYPDFLTKNSRACCQFNENNGSICYSEDILLTKDNVPSNPLTTASSVIKSWMDDDHDDWDNWDNFDDFDNFDNAVNNDNAIVQDEIPMPNHNRNKNIKTKVTHDLTLPNDMFSEYDDYYYYDDEIPSKPTKRSKRDTRIKRCKVQPNGASCCRCIESKDGFTAEEFSMYYNIFLTDNPNIKCPKSGHAAYGDAVRPVAIESSDSKIYQFPPMMINASNFMGFHTILKTSKDYYEALRWARKLTAELEETINKNLTTEEQVKVFPYSVFYVFYEQYLTMWEDTLKQLGISLLAIFVVTFFMMGLDFVSSVISLIVIMMILINLCGMMYW